MGRFFNNLTTSRTKWIFTAEVMAAIKSTIGMHRPEQGGILGSSDGVHIDHYYHDRNGNCGSAVYNMNFDDCNRVIEEWNDKGVLFVGVIHSHPHGMTVLSSPDVETAHSIINEMEMGGKIFCPIVQVNSKLNGEIQIFPYTVERSVEVKNQPIGVEETTPELLERKRLQAEHNKAPNRFARIDSAFPQSVMKTKTVICIGCGGSRAFLESLARCGVGNFVLLDGDVVEDTNIATQGTFVSEIGKKKAQVIRDRILDVNPTANVRCIERFLDDDMSDDEFLMLSGLNTANYGDVLLCGCTDSFPAQARCEQLAFKLGIPYLAAQIFAKGVGAEVIFHYPNLTRACPRCMLATRYASYAAEPFTSKGASEGSAVWVTDFLNSVKTNLALKILCFNEPRTKYYRELNKYSRANYFMIRYSSDLDAPAFQELSDLERNTPDLSFPFVVTAIDQEVESDCPLCGGVNTPAPISDSRIIPGINN